jgi:nitrate reductase gamma subunit
MDSKRLWTGRVLTALAVMFLVFDGAFKLLTPQAVLDATARLGLPPGSIVPVGLLLLACTLLYAMPRTRFAGAVLLTGYLGGAVATQMRAASPLFETIFPVIAGSIVWAGVFLRDRRAWTLLTEGPAADRRAARHFEAGTTAMRSPANDPIQ